MKFQFLIIYSYFCRCIDASFPAIIAEILKWLPPAILSLLIVPLSLKLPSLYTKGVAAAILHITHKLDASWFIRIAVFNVSKYVLIFKAKYTFKNMKLVHTLFCGWPAVQHDVLTFHLYLFIIFFRFV